MKKILFIDDEKELHPVIQNIFPKEQYRLICAFDGLEGMQKCRNEEFDVIIVDYRMPKMDGVKFYQQLRDVQESKKQDFTSVIFISGSEEEVNINKKVKWEKCGFLKKPFTKDELILKIQDVRDEKIKVSPKRDSKILVNPGESLINEGDDAQNMYFVMSGIFDSFKIAPTGEKKFVGKVGPGELMGEMAVLCNEKHLLTFIAVEACEVIQIPSEKILSIVNGQPKWIKLMLESMSKRLRDTLKQIA